MRLRSGRDEPYQLFGFENAVALTMGLRDPSHHGSATYSAPVSDIPKWAQEATDSSVQETRREVESGGRAAHRALQFLLCALATSNDARDSRSEVEGSRYAT